MRLRAHTGLCLLASALLLAFAASGASAQKAPATTKGKPAAAKTTKAKTTKAKTTKAKAKTTKANASTKKSAGKKTPAKTSKAKAKKATTKKASAKTKKVTSHCVGLAQTACGRKTTCGWTKGYKRKDGKQVKGYCRLSQKKRDTKTAKVKKAKTTTKKATARKSKAKTTTKKKN